ncbi:MAG: glycogen synthase GlgA [Acidobacteriota bacterium]|nr:glycogen synthase GlgA [Acidobacteriota bacterium]
MARALAASKAPSKAPKKAAGLRILMVASEAQPFSKTGGLADVATALAKALGRLGHDVTVMTPRYRAVAAGAIVGTVTIEVASHAFRADLHEVTLGPGARVLLVDCPELYDRRGIYNEDGKDYPDNAVRYAFLSAAAVNWASQQAKPFDVLHAHDWQSGLVPVYARSLTGKIPGTVFTIHNLAYQGLFSKAWVPRLGLRWQDFTIGGFEFYDQLSFLKAGLAFASAITTVSPTYAEEIQRPEYGHGLDGVVRARRDVLAGMLNGIDTDEWNPATDPLLPQPFDAAHLGRKAASKKALLEMFGLPADEHSLARPVIGMVSRMVDQKGLDLIAAVASVLPALGASFVIVGTGEPRYQGMWTRLSELHPDRISAFIGFDERRAHLVEGGADIFLMPSRFEPCGLNQMYSMRYGTVPVVRAVGGLVDTVRPYNPRNGQGTGLLFSEYRPDAMLDALGRALSAFGNKKLWTRLQKNGMRADFSWDRSAAEYVKMYKRVRRIK